MSSSESTSLREAPAPCLYALLGDTKYSDATLRSTDAKEYPVHRNVVCIFCPVLEVMLSDRWLSNGQRPIEMEMDSINLEYFLVYLYTGDILLEYPHSKTELDLKLKKDLLCLITLYRVGDYYCLPLFKECIFATIVRNICSERYISSDLVLAIQFLIEEPIGDDSRILDCVTEKTCGQVFGDVSNNSVYLALKTFNPLAASIMKGMAKRRLRKWGN